MKFILILSFFIPFVISSFSVNDDILIKKGDKWFRGWVVKKVSDDSSLVARTWNAEKMEIIKDSELKPNKYSKMDSLKKRVTGWKGYDTGIWHISKSSKGNYLVVASGSGELNIFEEDTIYPVKKIPKDGKIFDISIDPAGKVLAVCNREGDLKFYSVPSGSLIKKVKISNRCDKIVFNNSSILAYVGADKKDGQKQFLTLFNYKNGKKSKKIYFKNVKNEYISVVTFSPDGKNLALGLANKKSGIKVFKVDNLKLKFLKYIKHKGDIYGLSYTPDGNFFAAGGMGGYLELYNSKNYKKVWQSKWRGKRDFLMHVDISLDGEKIAVCGMGRGYPVTIYNFKDGKLLDEIGKKISMNCDGIYFSNNNKNIFTVRQLYSNFGEVVLNRYFLK